MGFRSTFVTQDYDIEWPDWFIDKYQNAVFFNESRKGVIASKIEMKAYGFLSDFALDVQKAIKWEDFSEEFKFNFVFLHESGRVNRVTIARSIIYEDAIEWIQILNPSTY